MAHRLRYVKPETVFEMVRRTEHGRFAFAPTPALRPPFGCGSDLMS
jgi:hypothetical protein